MYKGQIKEKNKFNEG